MAAPGTPVVRWTPADGWLMIELARRSLSRSINGGVFGRVEPVIENATETVLVVDGTGTVTLRLDVSETRHRWRSGWFLEVACGETRAMLSEEQREVVVEARGRIELRPRLAQRALQRELAGELMQVPIVDVAGHKYTRQSSAVDPGDGLVPWAAATTPEAAPWWELDLGKTWFLAWLRVDLTAPPPGTRVVIRAYAHVQPDLSPPTTSAIFEARAEELAAHAGQVAITVANDVVARYVRVELVSEAPVVLEVRSTEVLAAELSATTLESTLRRSFALFRDRPLIVARDGDAYTPVATYGQIWERAVRFARGLAARVETRPSPATTGPLAGRHALAITLRSKPEWLVADLAGLIRGYVSVPISPDESDDRLAHILSRAPASCIVCEDADAERLRRIAPAAVVITLSEMPAVETEVAAPEPEPRTPGDLYAVLFTSGSTGSPKGAMRTYATFFAMVSTYQVGHSPRHLSFQPLSHLSERMYLPALLIHGGTIYFAKGGAAIYDELKTFGPTTLGSVPRLFEVLHATYRRRLKALIAAEPAASRGSLEAKALAEARASFGPNLTAISIGSAPVSAEVFGFLKRAFPDIWVTEGYGSTEVGTIATDGVVTATSQVKLVPLPERPDPDRGEIWVKSPHAISGYLGDPEATAAAFDADGYFATGDLGQRDAAGKIKVVGRLRNTVKLAQGEFVSAERIETALASCPLVDRIFVHAANGATGVAALVVPSRETDPAQLLAALRAQGKNAGLAPYELPRGVLIETTPFTAASGLITGNGKLARGTIAKRFGDRLAELAAGAPAELADAPVERDDSDDDLRTRVVRVASAAIGRPLAIDAVLADAGVDSLASAEILAALSDELGRDIPLAWWFEARTLDDLATRLARFAEISGPAALRDRATADLALPPIIGSTTWHPPKHVLLTGATGFLGAHLVEALHDRGLEVSCLVRSPDKLAAALAARRIVTRPPTIVRGDLAAAGLGLGELPVGIDTVVHSGALVSWLASYDAIRAPNVLGTRALLELAAAKGWVFHHVSTISTTRPDGDETTSLTFEAALASTPYGLSKWIAEQHVKRSTLPFAIYRPAMIAAHTQRGIGNPDDFLCRYLAGCLELGLYVDRDDAILDMTPVDYVAGAIAALVTRPTGGHTYHLANIAGSLSFAGVGRAIARAGHAVKPASYEEFRSALARSKGRLHALAAFFPEHFNLGMGPFPDAWTREALDGITPSKIDDAYLARCLAALH